MKPVLFVDCFIGTELFINGNDTFYPTAFNCKVIWLLLIINVYCNAFLYNLEHVDCS
jgi:hypothetical protein